MPIGYDSALTTANAGNSCDQVAIYISTGKNLREVGRGEERIVRGGAADVPIRGEQQAGRWEWTSYMDCFYHKQLIGFKMERAGVLCAKGALIRG